MPAFLTGRIRPVTKCSSNEYRTFGNKKTWHFDENMHHWRFELFLASVLNQNSEFPSIIDWQKMDVFIVSKLIAHFPKFTATC